MLGPLVACFFGLGFRRFKIFVVPVFRLWSLLVSRFLLILLFVNFILELSPSLKCQMFSAYIFLIFHFILLCCIFLLFTVINFELNHIKLLIPAWFNICNSLFNLLNHRKNLIFLSIFIINFAKLFHFNLTNVNFCS